MQLSYLFPASRPAVSASCCPRVLSAHCEADRHTDDEDCARNGKDDRPGASGFRKDRTLAVLDINDLVLLIRAVFRHCPSLFPCLCDGHFYGRRQLIVSGRGVCLHEPVVARRKTV